MLPEPERPVHGVRLEALEPLLFGDNRPARAGVDPWQADQDPSPLTVHGAIGRLLAGPPGGTWPDGLLGPQVRDILAPGETPVAQLLGWCYEDAEGHLLFPRPAHLRCRQVPGRPAPGGRVVAHDLALPEPLGERKSRASSAELAWEKDEEKDYEGPVLLARTDLRNVLIGELPDGQVGTEEHIFRREARPGIAVDNDRGTVFEGYFFTRPYRRFEPGGLRPGGQEAGLHAWFQTLAPLPAETQTPAIGFLGGDRRRVRVSFPASFVRRSDVLPRLLAAVETAAADAGSESRGFFLYLLTPAVTVDGVPPSWPGFGTPVASAIGKPCYASGWNVQVGAPRALQALVPAGSVYFYRWPPEAELPVPDRPGWIRRHWLAPLQPLGAAAGFGRLLLGVW
jgi:CRISPR type III-B/RAMP module-associated protein Cmr3